MTPPSHPQNVQRFPPVTLPILALAQRRRTLQPLAGQPSLPVDKATATTAIPVLCVSQFRLLNRGAAHKR